VFSTIIIATKSRAIWEKKGGFAASKVTKRQKAFTISAQAADITVILL
jgi:hypothetical protein